MDTNADKLVMVSVIGEIISPQVRTPYRIAAWGEPMVLPGTGGITYNVRIGDPATGWEADHMEPGVTIRNMEKSGSVADAANNGLNVLSCVGNQATVVSGDGKGERGIVTGKHGGAEHVLVDFPTAVLDRLVIGDRVMIRSWGVGLKFPAVPSVKVMNLSPDLVDKWGLRVEDGKLVVPVAHTVPAATMGSGLGAADCHTGDYDIQLFDKKTVDDYGLAGIRLGDFVAIMDADHSFGRIYKQGAVSVGIVVHSDCIIAGHGPGVTTLLTSSAGAIVPEINPKANLADVLHVRA
ncbi:MAG: DUF4438 domain-containing protein [Chloroflexi bacterium]|nr:DUF4438 domain-containing protein [Chloroflexota bacterium]